MYCKNMPERVLLESVTIRIWCGDTVNTFQLTIVCTYRIVKVFKALILACLFARFNLF